MSQLKTKNRELKNLKIVNRIFLFLFLLVPIFIVSVVLFIFSYFFMYEKYVTDMELSKIEVLKEETCGTDKTYKVKMFANGAIVFCNDGKEKFKHYIDIHGEKVEEKLKEIRGY